MTYTVKHASTIEIVDANQRKIFPKFGGQTRSVVMAGTKYIGQVFSIPAVDTVINLSALTNPKYAVFVNLDDTNFVEYGPVVLVPFGQLDPVDASGNYDVHRLNLASGVTLRMQADTAACDVFVFVAEE